LKEVSAVTRPWLPFPLLLALAALPAAADAPVPATDRVAQTHALADLTPGQARHLEGRLAKYRVRLSSDYDVEDGQVIYECAGPEDAVRTVWFPGGSGAEADELVVEAVLRVIRYGGFTEYRLAGARVVP
jgi:hypothetical protein